MHCLSSVSVHSTSSEASLWNHHLFGPKVDECNLRLLNQQKHKSVITIKIIAFISVQRQPLVWLPKLPTSVMWIRPLCRTVDHAHSPKIEKTVSHFTIYIYSYFCFWMASAKLNVNVASHCVTFWIHMTTFQEPYLQIALVVFANYWWCLLICTHVN